MMENWILYAAIVVVVLAALQDLRTLRISNYFPVLLFGLFGAWLVFKGVPGNLWENGVHFLIALGFGMLLFGLRWIGGGDAKLYAACACWFDFGAALTLLFLTGLAGFLLLVLMLITRPIRRRFSAGDQSTGEQQPKMQLPYGIAIAAGTIMTIYYVGVNPPLVDPFDPAALEFPAS